MSTDGFRRKKVFVFNLDEFLATSFLTICRHWYVIQLLAYTVYLLGRIVHKVKERINIKAKKIK